MRSPIRRTRRRAALGAALAATAGVAALLLLVAPLAASDEAGLPAAKPEPTAKLPTPWMHPIPLTPLEREIRARERRAEHFEEVHYRDSRALGSPFDGGRLLRGVRLPPEGRDFFTWDPILHRAPNRHWRRHGTDHLIRTTLAIARGHRRAHPGAPRLAIGDLSRPRGGDFGPQFGSLGHASHQNGLDLDVYYPRLDRRERAPRSVDQVDLRLAQDLVDRFVAAGAEKVFVGPSTPLSGPDDVVQALPNHDDHVHVRFPAGGA